MTTGHSPADFSERVAAAAGAAPRHRRRLRRPAIMLLWALGLAGSAVASGTGTIEGRVALPEAPPAPVVNQRYEIVAKGGVVAPRPPVAVVYLEGSFPPSTEIPVARMTQKDLVFIPHLLPVRTGTRVEFPNLDDTYHNIFSFSPPKRFDLGRYRAEERPVPSQVFDTPGLVTLRCDIHEHMRSVILVLDTPHFVVTDTAGRYRLTGLPAGRYVLKAWLDSRTTLERPVEVADGVVLKVDLP